MKRITTILALIFILLPAVLVAADKTTEEYIADLKSDDNTEVVNALRYLGTEQEEKALPDILNLLQLDKPFEVHLNTIKAIGFIKQKGDSVKALYNFLAKTKDRNLAYAVITALISIADHENSYSKKSLKVAKANFPDDIFIQDACKRIEEAAAKYGK